MQEFDRFLLSVVYDIPNLIFVVDTEDGTIIYANQFMCETLGAACIGRKFSEQFASAGAEHFFVSYQWNAPPDTTPDNAEILQQSEYYDDESENWYHVLQRPVIWHDGTRKIVFVLNEINALKRLQTDFSEAHAALALKNIELEVATNKLQTALDNVEGKVKERTAELETALLHLQESHEQLASSEARATLSTLVASASHELKTPLGNGVMAASTLVYETKAFAHKVDTVGLKRSELTQFFARMQEGTQLILHNLERADGLLNHFRQVATDQASEQQRTFDLAETVRDIVATLAPSLKRHSHRVVVDIAPGIQMDSQPGALGQVVINLINNAYLHAFEHRSDGVLTIRGEADDDRVSLIFCDNGCGMPSETLERIFQPFFSTKLGKGGTGLGMAIVKNLANKTLGGDLQVTSTLGEGTRIDIQLPRILHTDS
ncbi:MAG: PAS domain-containing sensor histidine kinase [Rhodoferax sp.]|nr:PAS domain-containing sensor histidine kinase [Rhodoferax sp.]